MARKTEDRPPEATEAAPLVESAVPSFATAFPRDPELDALVAAFARGDYRHVRAEAPGLAKRSADPAIRRAALELRARIDPDPLGRALIMLSAGLLLVLAYFYLVHQHGPP